MAQVNTGHDSIAVRLSDAIADTKNPIQESHYTRQEIRPCLLAYKANQYYVRDRSTDIDPDAASAATVPTTCRAT